MVTLITMAFAIVIGAVAGFFGGWTDNILMRITEVFLVFPSFLFILVFVRVFTLTARSARLFIFLASHSAWADHSRLGLGYFQLAWRRENGPRRIPEGARTRVRGGGKGFGRQQQANNLQTRTSKHPLINNCRGQPYNRLRNSRRKRE